VNKTLLVGGKLYIWENGNWTATARSREPGALFCFQEAITRGATLAIEPYVAGSRAFPSRAALNRGIAPAGNWSTQGSTERT